MKIVDVRTHVLATPMPAPFAFSMGWVRERSAMLVEVTTDTGVTGWGESLCHGLQPPEIAAAIVDTALRPIVMGQDPFDVDVLWERMYNLTRPFGQKGAVPKAISAVDIALWDCMGRSLDMPTTSCWVAPTALGCSPMPPASTASRAETIPMPPGIHWFEEPLSPEDIDGYRELKNLTSIYIAAGECEFTKFGYREWASKRAVDILQPDLCSAGGFTECRKISALAQAWHMTLIPHVWGTGIGLAAALQFIATVPPSPLALNPIEPMLEYDQSSHPYREELIFGAIKLEDGMVTIPTGPGLGIDINRDVIERYQKRP